jgi:uncharacterized protein (DUF362 family)
MGHPDLQTAIIRVLAEIQSETCMVDASGLRTAARLAAVAANLCADPNNCRVCNVQCQRDVVVSRY